MVRRFLVTVRIQRPGGPPRVRTFVVQFPRPVGEQAAPSARTVAALVLMRVRSQSRQLPRPERPDVVLLTHGAWSPLHKP
ncbi:tumor suppressor ARF-like [Castor canadensis]|uniref:Tumor suppressor ARF-like n=1 Tax=Castor canadensis TaxID=51338 RepID=A0AC58KUZ6_CASCN